MKKLLTIAFVAIIVTVGAAVFTNSADAYRGDPSVRGQYYNEERHEAMEKAFEEKDYEAWKNLMQGRGRVTQVINKNNFAKFAKAHELAEQGKLEEAKKIRQELGLGIQNGLGQGKGMGCWNK